jgi:GNAT superfamily N-acetyltransferase
MNNNLKIRSATVGDVDKLVEFNAAMALETEHKILDPKILHSGVHAIFDEPRRGFYLVAEMDGQTIGCLMITYEWSDWRNGAWWWLQSVYVVPDHRRGGIFRGLYRQVEESARKTAGVIGLRLYVERENETAQRTYASLGMSETAYRLFETEFPRP